MRPARRPRDKKVEQKLLVIGDQANDILCTPFENLGRFLRAGDLLVVNDAATFPASLHGSLSGSPVELRLLPKEPETVVWRGILFGKGDWREKTEDRLPPPAAPVGTSVEFSTRLKATVVVVAARSPRLVDLRFSLEGKDLWLELYRIGKPIQYSYQANELELWDIQTAFASRPWASEVPSAAIPLRWDLLLRLRKQGIEVAPLTHSTGLSSTGDARLDAQLPFPEFYAIPEKTVQAVKKAKQHGRRVIAVGTSVVRALEGNVQANGHLVPGLGRTALIIDKNHKLKVPGGILTGVHEMAESHFRLLEAFCDAEKLTQGLRVAEDNQLMTHEFGDSTLILRR